MVGSANDISCSITVVKKNGTLGGRYELDTRKWCILGNHNDCDIRIDSKKVAPLQALVTIVDRKVILEGLDTEIPAVIPNVTSLYKGDKYQVRDQESFFIGNRLFRFSLVPPGKERVLLETQSHSTNNVVEHPKPRSSRTNATSSAMSSVRKAKRRTSLLVTDTDEIIVNAESSGNLFPVCRLDTPSKDVSAQFANDPPRTNDIPFTPKNAQTKDIGGMKINLAYAFGGKNAGLNVPEQVEDTPKDDLQATEAEVIANSAKKEFKGTDSQTSSMTAQEVSAKIGGLSDVSSADSGNMAHGEPSIKATAPVSQKEPTSGRGVKSPSARQKLIYARLSQGLPATPLKRESAPQPSGHTPGPKMTPMRKRQPAPSPKSAYPQSSARKKVSKLWSSSASEKAVDPIAQQPGEPKCSHVLPQERTTEMNIQSSADQSLNSSSLQPGGLLSITVSKPASSPRRKSVLFARSIELEAGPHYSPVRKRTEGQSRADNDEDRTSIVCSFQSHPQPSLALDDKRQAKLQERVPGPPPNEQLGLLGVFSYPKHDDSIKFDTVDDLNQQVTPRSEVVDNSHSDKGPPSEIAEIELSTGGSGSFGGGLANLWRRISGGRTEYAAKDHAESSTDSGSQELGGRSNSNTLSTSTGYASSGLETTTVETEECTTDTSNCSESDGGLEDSEDEEDFSCSDGSGIAGRRESNQFSTSGDSSPGRDREQEYSDEEYAVLETDQHVLQNQREDAKNDEQEIWEQAPDQCRDTCMDANGTSLAPSDTVEKENSNSTTQRCETENANACYLRSDTTETPVVKFPLSASESTGDLTSPEHSGVKFDIGEEVKGSVHSGSKQSRLGSQRQTIHSCTFSSSSEEEGIVEQDYESPEEEDDNAGNQEDIDAVNTKPNIDPRNPADASLGSSVRRASLMDTVFSVAKKVTNRFSVGRSSSRASGATENSGEDSEFDPEDLETASESSEEYDRDNDNPDNLVEPVSHETSDLVNVVNKDNAEARELDSPMLLSVDPNSDLDSGANLTENLPTPSAILEECKLSPKAKKVDESIIQNEDECFMDKTSEEEGGGPMGSGSGLEAVHTVKGRTDERTQTNEKSPDSGTKHLSVARTFASPAEMSKHEIANSHTTEQNVNEMADSLNTVTVSDNQFCTGNLPVEELGNKTVVELRKLLKEYGLSTAGNKAALVERLTEHISPVVFQETVEPVDADVEVSSERAEVTEADKVKNIAVTDACRDSLTIASTEADFSIRSPPDTLDREQCTDMTMLEGRKDTTEVPEEEELVSMGADAVDENEDSSVDRSLYRKKTVKELQALLKSCLTRTPGRLRKEEIIDLLIANDIGPDGNSWQTATAPEILPSLGIGQTEALSTPRASAGVRRANNFATPLPKKNLDSASVPELLSSAKGSAMSTRKSRPRSSAKVTSSREGKSDVGSSRTPLLRSTRRKVFLEEKDTARKCNVAAGVEDSEKSAAEASRSREDFAATSRKSVKESAVGNDCAKEDECLCEEAKSNNVSAAERVDVPQPNGEYDFENCEEEVPRSVRRSTRKAVKLDKIRKSAKSALKEKRSKEDVSKKDRDTALTDAQDLSNCSKETNLKTKTPSKGDERSQNKKNKKNVKLERLTVGVLRQMLHEAGSCQSGTKNILIARLHAMERRSANYAGRAEDSCKGCQKGEACVLGGGKR